MKRKKKEQDPAAEAESDVRTEDGPAERASGDRSGGEATLESVMAERDEYLELWKRAQADYKNLRRRAQAELEAGTRRAMQPLLDSLLLVLDHLDMALMAPTPNDETKNYAVGVEMTRNQLVTALRQEGVVEISTQGAFDPELHQAVSTVESPDVEPGAIVATIRKGYTWNDLVLRPAHVSVAAAPGGRADAPPSSNEAERSTEE